MSEAITLDECMLEEARQGRLMPWLSSSDRSVDELRDAVDRIAALHREGRIDLLVHLGRPADAEDWRPDYLAWCNVYRLLVPAIEDDARRVVSVVEELGTGIWESPIWDAFIEWCAQNLSRARAVLALAGEDGVPVRALTGALIAGMRRDPSAYIDTAVAHASGAGPRMPGIRGMACMAMDDPEAVRQAIETLGSLVRDASLPIEDRVSALAASLEIASRGGVDEAVVTIVADALASGASELDCECCAAVVRHGRSIRGDLLAVLLTGLERLDLGDPVLRSTVDSAFYVLFSAEREMEALPVLASLLRRGIEGTPFAGLESAAHIISHTPDLFARVACRWLLTGEAALSSAVRHLLNCTGDQRFSFRFEPGNADWPDGMAAFVARKAIGWLMPHAVAPASFIVCLLPAAKAAEADVLAGLLSDPILVNYPVGARAYLDGVRSRLPEAQQSRISQILAEHDAYVGAIEAVGNLPELQPNERQRWIERQRQGEMWAEAHQAARGASKLLSMVGTQTVLHGVTAICYVDDLDGTTRRLVNRLRTMSYSAEAAMGHVHDPTLLDYLLRAFRVERPPG